RPVVHPGQGGVPARRLRGQRRLLRPGGRCGADGWDAGAVQEVGGGVFLPSPLGGEGMGVRGLPFSPLSPRGRGDGGEGVALAARSASPSPPTPLPRGERGGRNPLTPALSPERGGSEEESPSPRTFPPGEGKRDRPGPRSSSCVS